ncbi:La-related protein 6A [Capsicum annuum]|nr:La-related protein 6A [Capsicum annuum]
MESDGGGGGGVVPIPSHTGLSPPHDDDHPDFSPVGSPESQPSDQLSATLLTDDLRNNIVKQVEYYFSDENLPTDKFLLKYVTRDKEGFVPVKVLASFRKVKKLTKETSVIAAALRESSLLVVSPDGRKVKRLHPLPLSEIKDPKVCTVLVENLPEDHSVDNLRCIFGQAGNVKHITIRDPHTERDPRKCTTAEKLLSGKLHAVVEYYSVEAAEKAVSILNDEQDWRFGLRVKLLKKTNKPGQSKKCWRDQDSDRNNNIQASDLAGNEENHSSEHPVDSQDEELRSQSARLRRHRQLAAPVTGHRFRRVHRKDLLVPTRPDSVIVAVGVDDWIGSCSRGWGGGYCGTEGIGKGEGRREAKGPDRALSGDWWWNEEVKKKVETKKGAYAKLVERERGEKGLFGLAKARERKGRDLDQVKCIKGEDGTVLVEDGHMKNRWQSYFHRLLNDERDRASVLGELEHSEECRDFSYCRRFKVEEVREVVRRMRRGRATGPDEIPVDFWKFSGEAGLRWLTGLFNGIFKMAKMPEAWRWSTMIPLYKNKGDIQSCNNYRGIKLLSHSMKIWERVIEVRLRRIVYFGEPVWIYARPLDDGGNSPSAEADGTV